MATNKQSRSKMPDEKGQRCLFELDEQDQARSDVSSASMAKHTRRHRRRQCRPDDLDLSDQLQEWLHPLVERLELRLATLEQMLVRLAERESISQPTKEFYTTAEAAQILGKRPYTVREWCRLGRVRGDKAHSGRGLDEEWRVSHEELMRIQNEGLLAVKRESRVQPPPRLGR